MKKKNNIIKYLLVILISTLLVLGGYHFYQEYQKEKLLPSVNDLIKEKKEKNYQDKDENKIDTSTYTNLLPSYREQYNNPYIMGKLEIPNLNIDSLVTRAANNEFYLNNNLYNQQDGLGVPFFDYRNIELGSDKQINIYGHNTTNQKYYEKLPFINLEAYTDENIFKNYKEVYLSIDEKQMQYEVVAIKIINDTDNEHMKVIFYSEEDYLSHVSKLLQNTLYKENNLEISKEDRLLVLQVCHYNPKGTYLLVICKEKK